MANDLKNIGIVFTFLVMTFWHIETSYLYQKQIKNLETDKLFLQKEVKVLNEDIDMLEENIIGLDDELTKFQNLEQLLKDYL